MTSRAAALQNINQALVDQTSYQNSVLNATPSGSASTACLRFNVAAAGVGFATEVGTLATDGTVVSITQTGVYQVELVVSQTGAVTNTFGLALGGTAPITAIPVFGTAGCFQAVPLIGVANLDLSIPLVGIVLMRTVTAKATAGLSGLNNIRALGATTGPAAPTGVVAARFSLRIQQINSTSM